MLDQSKLERLAAEFLEGAGTNVVSKEVALTPEMEGLRIYDRPIFGCAAADDPLFEEFREAGVVGPQFLPPREWMAEAVSVVSFFLPYTEQVRAANRQDFRWPATEWLHGRIEGQKLVGEMMGFLCDVLRREGFRALAPVADNRFRAGTKPGGEACYRFNSNWSERHVAHACGLGTFSLNRGLITAKGIAGRFGSILTDLPLKPSGRPYSDPFAYCVQCGACAAHCPVGAIDIETGKDNAACGAFVDATEERHSPYYGCGKCQVAVPCETGIPTRPGGAWAKCCN